MPMRPAPRPEENTATRDVAPPGWETSGPKREYFRILTYTDPAVVLAAQKASRQTTVSNGKSAEELSRSAYLHHLFTAQLKGWRLLVDPSVAPDPATMEEEGGYLFWQYTPANVAALPWDLADWLDEQIRNCGGGLPTSALVTVADDGTLLDFRRSSPRVADGEASGHKAAERAAVV